MALLSLPRELRDQIYIFTLCPRGPNGALIPGSFDELLDRRRNGVHHPQLSILLVNHQIYAEAHPILYSLNVFYINRSATLKNFLDSIGVRGREHLRAICLKPTPETISNRVGLANALARVPRLERLELLLKDFDLLSVGRVTPHADIAARLDCTHNYSWLTGLSGLKHFAIKVQVRCTQNANMLAEGESCPCLSCTTRPMEDAMRLEEAVRMEVYQPRAEFQKSPRYLARQVEQKRQRVREEKRQRMLRDRERFRERMQWELEHRELKDVHRELRTYFVGRSEEG